jgi:hypothetical protein
MSQLDQAKREAARLLKIAKKNEYTDTPPFKLTINNLSHAKEHIANINGYPNWNIFEKELNKRDSIQDKTSTNKQREAADNLLSNIEFFSRELLFTFHPNTNTKETYKTINDKPYTPIKLGDFLPKGFSSMTEKFSNKSKYWSLTSYPVAISGSTGSGKTESLLSMSHQYIENGEGLLYFDGKGDTSIYSRFFSIAKQNNRLDDLYLLNFLVKDNHGSKITHTIDPINPLIGDETAFKILFGDKMGVLLHELSKCVKSNNGLVSVENIESFLMLDTLHKIKKDPLFANAVSYIDDYLNNLDYDVDETLRSHVLNCDVAFPMINTLITYRTMFTINPDISLEKSLYKRKIILTLLPSLEKSWDSCQSLVNLLMLNLNKVIKEFEHRENTQTVIMDDMASLISNNLADYLTMTNTQSINMIYAVQDFYRETRFMNQIIKSAKTFVLMKGEYTALPDAIQLRIMNDLTNFPPFYKSRNIRSQNAGEAMVFGYNDYALDKKTHLNHERGYSFSPLKLIYRPVEMAKYIYLNKKEM